MKKAKPLNSPSSNNLLIGRFIENAGAWVSIAGFHEQQVFLLSKRNHVILMEIDELQGCQVFEKHELATAKMVRPAAGRGNNRKGKSRKK